MTINVSIGGLRNDQGTVRLVICPAGHPFPDCGPAGVTQVVGIRNRMARASFHGVLPGTYAIAAFHDQNGNGKLDTFLGVPREGFGFSGNPPVRPHAPHFSDCAFAVANDVQTTVTMRYLF